MIVDAITLETGQPASVTKSLVDEVVKLTFGLPRGERGETGATGPQGEKGDTGDTGPQGPKGDTGNGFKIMGYYASLSALQQAVPSPAIGDAYGIGTAEPYDIYIWGGSSWVDNGPIQGPAGPQGEQGPTGESGVYYGVDEPSNSDIKVWIDSSAESSPSLPQVSDADNGKILKVVNGKWAATTLPIYNGEAQNNA